MAGVGNRGSNTASSLCIAKSRIIWSSGVICGVTSNFNTAFLKEIVAEPLEEASK